MQKNKIIYTPEFKNWFGDWERNKNCSKIVDDYGYPLIVYHGTNKDFDIFDSKYMGQTGTALGQGFYFTDKKENAESFGNIIKGFYLNIKKPLNKNKLTIKPRELSYLIDTIDKVQSKNDKDFGYGILSEYGDVDYDGRSKVLYDAVKIEMSNENDVELIGSLINASGDYNVVVKTLLNTLGYDGVIDKDRGIYIAHHPNQIKQITNKSFNKNSDNINENIKKIYITENQLKLITNYL